MKNKYKEFETVYLGVYLACELRSDNMYVACPFTKCIQIMKNKYQEFEIILLRDFSWGIF